MENKKPTSLLLWLSFLWPLLILPDVIRGETGSLVVFIFLSGCSGAVVWLHIKAVRIWKEIEEMRRDRGA